MSGVFHLSRAPSTSTELSLARPVVRVFERCQKMPIRHEVREKFHYQRYLAADLSGALARESLRTRRPIKKLPLFS